MSLKLYITIYIKRAGLILSTPPRTYYNTDNLFITYRLLIKRGTQWTAKYYEQHWLK